MDGGRGSPLAELPPAGALPLSRRLIAGLLGIAALALQAGPGQAAERACFDSREVRDWSALGDQTLLLRVRLTDYYRIDLSHPVRHIRSPAAHLALVSHEPAQICQVGDLDARILLSPGFSISLPVSSLQQLDAAAQAAIGETHLPGRHQRRRAKP